MKRNAPSRRASAGARDLQDAPVIRLGLLLPVLLVGAAAGGALGGWQLWRGRNAPAVAPLPPWEDSFAGAAFSPDATAQQLYQEAEQVIADLLEALPQKPAALNVLARWKYVSGDLDQAAEVWQQCLEADPNFSEALYALGSIAIDGDDYERAIQLFRRVRLLGSSDPRVPVLLAEALLKAGRVEESRAVLEQHIRTQPTSAEAMVILGQVYLQSRDYEKALKSFETALRAVPEMRTALYGLGQAHARMGQTEQARQAMERFQVQSEAHLQHESRKAKAFHDREFASTAVAQVHDDAAKVYHQHALSRRAEQLWRKAVFLDPQNSEYWGRLLTLYEQTARHREALQVSRKLAQIDPQNVDHWLNVGVLSARVERPAEAIAAVEQAIRIAPDNPRCREAYELVKQAR